jgi:glycosyltransferase involved in cell wall biosynthesis
MKIALVHDWLTGMRGGEKCLEVVCRRYPDAELFTLLHKAGSASPAIERMRIRTSFLQRVPGIGRHYRYWLPAMPRAIESLRLPGDVDLVLSFSHAVAKGIRVPPGVPHVCYCFTPMRYAWQLREDYFGTGRRGRFARWLPGRWPAAARDVLLERVRRWDLAASQRVTHYVAISHTVARRIAECYGRSSRVIYPPVDTRFYCPAAVPRDDYYLCVSALVPYKKIDLAVRACRRLGRRLIVIGAGPEASRLAALAGRHVQLLGWRSDEEVREHMRRCRALVFPGQEDFGIVPVEAQACGTPVIAFNRGGATETIQPAGELRRGTGFLFSQQTAECLCEAIEWFERHPDQFSPHLARGQAVSFDTERYQRELLAYLDEVAGGQEPSRRLAA